VAYFVGALASPDAELAPEGIMNMPISTFVLETASFSRLFVPPSTDKPNLRRYYSVVPISQIPQEWENWLEINARNSTDKGRVPQAIRQTLTDKPEWFAEYNRGLTVVASRAHWDNKTSRLTLEFQDPEYDGILDGGHTLRVILEQMGEQSSEDGTGLASYCNLEILTGLEGEVIPSVVEARNTSRQVAHKSLLNLDGKFDKLKDVIGTEKTKEIIWKENDGGMLDVREFVGMLTAVEGESFTSNNHPITAYSGKEACLKRFSSEEHEPKYQKLIKIAPDLLEMWDLIQDNLPSQYNQKGPEPGTSGKFGRLSGVKSLSAKKRKWLPFIKKHVDYDIPTGYLYPILAAFRAMLEEEDGYWVWGKGLDPRQLIKEGVAADIFIDSVRHSIANHHNANRTGKDNQAWNSAYQAARIYYLEQG
jgi:hypothetical protein